MFGDNQAVVKSSTIPEAKLHKRHTLLSFHRVCKAIVARMIVFVHIDGHINPADILRKHWGHQQVWGNLKPLLFWAGDTIDTFVHDGVKKESEKKSEASKGRGVSEIPIDPITDKWNPWVWAQSWTLSPKCGRSDAAAGRRTGVSRAIWPCQHARCQARWNTYCSPSRTQIHRF
jgi:hypothetical protein